jgi:hypothetical protein
MMPIVLGDLRSIPKHLRKYAPLICACPGLVGDELGKVAYLTIVEGTVSADGETQRRGGIHCESPGLGICGHGGKFGGYPCKDGCADMSCLCWGAGVYEEDNDDDDETMGEGEGGERAHGPGGRYVGGIYMASTVNNSTAVWNVKLKRPAEVIGPLGSLDHLRGVLGPPAPVQAGELLWITDLTPHESRPLRAGIVRQYFRLVTSNISVWYADHSTPNPLGVVPPARVRIVHGSKFTAARPAAALLEIERPGAAAAGSSSSGGAESSGDGEEEDGEAANEADETLPTSGGYVSSYDSGPLSVEDSDGSARAGDGEEDDSEEEELTGSERSGGAEDAPAGPASKANT